MIALQLHSEYAGFFKLEKGKCDADGNPIEATREVVADWFPNLILNQGLDLIGSNTGIDYMSGCAVGTDNTTPNATQTELLGFVARTDTVAANLAANSGASAYYNYRRRTYRFGAGDAEGNLSEVGVGRYINVSSHVLFSRALILDGGGSPTTITVLADEFLDVTYELRSYQSLSDSTGTITISGVDYDWTQRAIDIATVKAPSLNISNQLFSLGATAWTGALGAITATNPGGTGETATSATFATYSNGTYYRDATFVWSLAPNNTIRTIKFAFLHLPGDFQVEFDPVLPMDNTKKLTIVMRASWARKTLP